MTTEMTRRLDPGRDTTPINAVGDDSGVMLDPVTSEPIDERELAQQLWPRPRLRASAWSARVGCSPA